MKTVIGIILLLVFLVPVSSAELTIPRFEMATLGRIDDGFRLTSLVSADLAITGGYKYGLSLGFSFGSFDLVKTFATRHFRFDLLPGVPGDYVDIEDYNNMINQANTLLSSQGTLTFRMAKATIRDLFNVPLELSFFIGEGDDFCSGDEYYSRFGSVPIGTDYKGLFYFPTGIGGDLGRRYYGIYGVRGTGISLAFTHLNTFVPMIYIYESYPLFMNIGGIYGKPIYSGDLRFLLNFPVAKVEAFGGVSYQDSFMIRGGILSHFGFGNNVEFLVQAGLSGWDLNESVTIDNFFFLMEPRFHFGIFGLYSTIFFHPVIYNNILTPEERGRMDINLKFFVEIPNTGFSTGVESNLGLKINKIEDIKVYVAPFFSFLGSGIRWDTKARINLLGVDRPEDLFELYIGISTSF